MLTEQQASTTLEARCPGCGKPYPWASLPFMYTDDLGARCPDCGSVLMVGNDGNSQGNVSGACRLMLSEVLEGSGLQQELVELFGGEGELRVVVDRTGETRAIHLEPAASPEQS